jgi:hypothetical protein
MKFTKRVILTDLEKTLLAFSKAGYFLSTGWIKSWRGGMPVDPHGNPVPWFSFAANRFLESRLNKDLSVFEYGSGNSTLFLGSRVGKLISLEHNKKWFDHSNPRPFENTEIHYCPLEENNLYPEFPASLNKRFDIIVIDGRKRVISAQISVNCLSEAGVIIFDDSQRERYRDGIEFLKTKGFKSIDFWGMALGDYALKCTSVFYRNGNCLDI